ncbi:MAG: TraR/DksA family transcriptional regulator [Vicinamibacteria bacterium]|nr:TraR/DksA family transcriptional regulator [Vicinamibacteria bacterium]
MRKNQSRLKDERYILLKSMLEERRSDITEKLRSLRESLPTESGEVRDAEEQSVDDFVQDVDLTLMQMKAETLRKIDEALQRLENGTYGLCTECRKELPAARLRALPFAALCRDCQAFQEERETESRDTHDLENRLGRLAAIPAR